VNSLDDLPGHLIRRLHQIAVSAFVAEVEKAGPDLTPVQYAALHALDESPGIDQATLAGLIAIDKATVGAVVARLEARGWITREFSETDRRSRSLWLDEKGRRALARTTEAVLRAQVAVLQGLSAHERMVFVGLLRKVTDAGNRISRAPRRAPASPARPGPAADRLEAP
jgi:DNA-binding MarR family transcriptional regulator